MAQLVSFYRICYDKFIKGFYGIEFICKAGGKCSVLHIDDAGNVTDMHAVYENGYMVFTTNHFSYYALVEDASGVAVGGRITSYGTENGTVTVNLLDGEAEVERVETTDGTYAFSAVPSGTYTLRVSKANHVTRTYAITVESEDVTQDVKLCLIGDVTGDGKVNTRDLNHQHLILLLQIFLEKIL